MLLFMERSHGFRSISVNLDGSVIDLRHGLEFNVITPYAIHPLPLHIFVESFITTYDKLDKEVFFTLDIVQAGLSDELVMGLIAFVDLIRNGSEQAIAITFNVYDFQAFETHESSEVVLLLFNVLHFLLKKVDILVLVRVLLVLLLKLVGVLVDLFIFSCSICFRVSTNF